VGVHVDVRVRPSAVRRDNAAAQKEAYERQKDLLAIAMGLLGTVTGYYILNAAVAPATSKTGRATGLRMWLGGWTSRETRVSNIRKSITHNATI
jgi:hypothetical protein